MNYYELLQITPDASIEVIKAAYKALVKKYHPDNGHKDGNEKLQLLNEAYEILSDVNKRKLYDTTLRKENDQGFVHEQSDKKNDEDIFYEQQTEVRETGESAYQSKFGHAVHSFFQGVSQELQKNRQIEENAYFEGQQMDDYELTDAFKKNYGWRRNGYARVLEERGFLNKYNGRWVPTEEFKRMWR